MACIWRVGVLESERLRENHENRKARSPKMKTEKQGPPQNENRKARFPRLIQYFLFRNFNNKRVVSWVVYLEGVEWALKVLCGLVQWCHCRSEVFFDC